MMLVVLHIYRTINTTQYAVPRAWILAAHPVSSLRMYREYRVSNWCYSTCTCMICGNSRLRGWESSKVGIYCNIFVIGHVLARSLHFPVFIGGQSGARLGLACKCPDCPSIPMSLAIHISSGGVLTTVFQAQRTCHCQSAIAATEENPHLCSSWSFEWCPFLVISKQNYEATSRWRLNPSESSVTSEHSPSQK